MTVGFNKKGQKALEHFQSEINKMRGARASASMLEGIKVDYFGSLVPLNQLGMVSAPEPKQLVVQVYDAGSLDLIEKAISGSDLGLNPSRDGSLIRVNIPSLTEERRKDLIKVLNSKTEEARVVIRNIRREEIDIIKKDLKAKEISEDDSRKLQDDIQKVTDKFIKLIDEVFSKKEKEMMEV